MIYKIAYAGFVIMYIIGLLFDQDFRVCWVRYIGFLIMCVVLFTQIAGIA